MDDSSGKPARVGEANNLYLNLARDGHWQRKWTTVSSFSADMQPRQKSSNRSSILFACLFIIQWPVSIAIVIEMMSSIHLRPSEPSGGSGSRRGWRLGWISARWSVWTRQGAFPSATYPQQISGKNSKSKIYFPWKFTKKSVVQDRFKLKISLLMN